MPAPAGAVADPPTIPDSSNWVANGAVRAIARLDGNTYIGGDFTRVGPPVGQGASISQATGAYDSAYPKVTGGNIKAVAPDGSGGWFIGGSFTSVGGVARSRLAHIKTDKTLDLAWNPGASNTVNSIAVSGSTVYVGGLFTIAGGQGRNFLAALDATNGNATAWNPNASSGVNAVAVSGSEVYVGGVFTSVGGQARNRIAAICAADNCDGLGTPSGSATAWNPNASNIVYSIAVSGSTVYAGGSFTTLNGAATIRNRIAAICAADNCDGLGTPSGSATAWNPNANAIVFTIAVSGSTVYLGGIFTTLNGGATIRNRIAAICAADNCDGVGTPSGSATAWNPNANSTVFTIGVLGSTVYAGGAFTTLSGGIVSRNYIAAIDAVTGNATAWNPNPDAAVQALGVDASTVYAGGDFITFGGQTRNRLASFDAGGALTAWDPNANAAPVYALVASGSTIYVGGAFTNVGGAARMRIAALDATTGNATAWNPSANVSVNTIAVSGSTVYVGGLFTTLGGGATIRNRIAAICAADNCDGQGTLAGSATAWNPNADSTVNTVAVSGSTVYVGGAFISVGGQSRNRIAALDAGTGLATAWDPNANNPVSTIAVSGSTVYAGGSFTTLSGGATIRNRIAAICATDNCDGLGTASGSPTAWDPNANGTVNSVAVTGSTAYAGGAFSNIGGQNRSGLVALSTATGSATAWNPTPVATILVYSVYAAGSTARAGGTFTAMGSNLTGRYASFSTAPVNTVPPSVTGGSGGWAMVGQMLTCQNGAWDNDPSTYAYEWMQEATPIPGETGSTYVTQAADDTHSISCQVTATNLGGSNAADSSNSIAVDGTPPDTTITGQPPSLSNSPIATFSFESSEPSPIFECRLGNVLWTPCSSPITYVGLGDGSYLFSVRAYDQAGNKDPSPASYSWTIDTAAPDTTIDSHPADPTTSTSASFDFSSPDAGATFQCKLDSGSYAPCTNPKDYTGLADGSHTFYVRATDQAGNTDPTPASYTWTIDAQAPQTTIASNPSDPSNDVNPSFGFDSTEQNSTFECKLDSDSYASCSSPKDFTGLADGSHTFYVRATDQTGNTDPTPASYTWTIDTRPPSNPEPDTRAPQVTFLSGPPSAVREVDALFAFGADEARVGFVCRLDDEEWAPCESPEVVHGLTPGRHAFYVKAEDRAGNWSDEVAWSWLVDRRAPSVTKGNVKRGAVVRKRAFRSIHGIAADDYDGNVRVKVKLQIVNPAQRLAEGECAYLSLKTGHRIVHRCGIALTRVRGGERWSIPVLARVRARMKVGDRYALLIRTVDGAGNKRVEKMRFTVR